MYTGMQCMSFIMSILSQLKLRRQSLGLKQGDMLLRVGVSRQQYQRLEAQGNPRLDTLSLVAEGLESELMLIPKDRLEEVKALLLENNSVVKESSINKGSSLLDDPWQELLKDQNLSDNESL